MKNNKKLYLLAVFALAACIQEVSAMDSFQKHIQYLGDLNLAPAGFQVACYCALSFKNALSKEEALIKAGEITEAKKEDRDLLIFEKDISEITGRFKLRGFTVQLADTGDLYPLPNMFAGGIRDQAYLAMNLSAMMAFTNTNNLGFNREEMLVALEHELVHVFDRHSEKKIAVKSFLPAFNFFLSAGIYKGVSGCLDKFDELSKPIAQVIAVVSALGIAYTIKKSENLIKLAYDRSCEWKADRAILNSGDSNKIKNYKIFLQKTRGSDKNQKLPFYLRTHPTHDERIKACEKALAELEVAKK